MEGCMRLESARELKQSLPLHLQKTFTTGSPRLAATLPVAFAASTQRASPSYFLGITRKTTNEYKLAVRLQDRALENSALIEEISRRARGELDVRYVGRIRA